MGNWNKERAKRLDDKIASLPLKDIEIKEYVRDTDLTGLPASVAYRINGAHLYADIRTQRHAARDGFRGRRLVISAHFASSTFTTGLSTASLAGSMPCSADFHNQRLHSVIAKPYDDEASGLIAQLPPDSS